jgi:hypothetical protein
VKTFASVRAGVVSASRSGSVLSPSASLAAFDCECYCPHSAKHARVWYLILGGISKGGGGASRGRAKAKK